MVGDHFDGELAGLHHGGIGVVLRGVDQPDGFAEMGEPVALPAVQHDPLDAVALVLNRRRGGDATVTQRGERGWQLALRLRGA